MVLADLGADVLRLERPNTPSFSDEYDERMDILLRGRPSLALDLKRDADHALARRLATAADVLIDPFRPGTTERLGLGPDTLLAANPSLVYARMTGWGQDGPLAQTAGHDINYLALSGVLSLLGRKDSPPAPPLNLVADYGGGGMLLVVGVLAALVERSTSGLGQVVDISMVDGTTLEYALVLSLIQSGGWRAERESNFLDGGAPFYDTYATSDGRHMAVGALEPQFFRLLIQGLGLEAESWSQWNRDDWPAMREAFADSFGSRSRTEWENVFAGSDACVTPVLTPAEAAGHPHNVARQVFLEHARGVQPAPAPRFSRTRAALRVVAEDDDIVARWTAGR
jgi:alpha-methylacyl-CoA racemase